MSEATLQARSPLTGVALPGRYGRIDGAPGVLITERQACALATIIARRGRTGDVLAALSRAYGIAAIDGAKRVAAGGVAVAGISPGQWLAQADALATPDFVAQLKRSLDGIAAVSDQSDSRIILHVSGPRARDALAKGVPIDLDASAFPAGSVAQTAAAHIGLQIACIDAAPTFEVLAAQSFAASFWSWLTASAAEFGYEIGA